MKLSTTESFKWSSRRGYFDMEADKVERIRALLNSIPGCWYDTYKHNWRVPMEVAPIVNAVRQQLALEPLPLPEKPPLNFHPLAEGSHPYQLKYRKLVDDQGGGLAIFDPGLGKARGALLCVEEQQTALIICTAKNVPTWVNEIKQWYKNPSIYAYRAGKKWEYAGEQFIIVPYSMFAKVHEAGWLPSRIHRTIWDEMQHLANYKTDWTSASADYAEKHPETYRLGLSATPAPDKIYQLYQPVHIFWPFRWGKPDEFKQRYCRIEYNGKWKVVRGLTEIDAMANELKERISGISVSATKKEWAHLLPKLNVVNYWTDPPEEYKKLVGRAKRADKLDTHIAVIKKVKAEIAIAQCLEYARNGETRIALGAWHKDVAHHVYDELSRNKELKEQGFVFLYMDGETHLPHKREGAVNDFVNANRKTIFIHTQASVLEGMNKLVAFKRAIAVEVHPRVANLRQWIGRFHRLSSTNDVEIFIVLCYNTLDERIYELFKTKLNELMKVLESGTTEDAINAADHAATDDWKEQLLEGIPESGGEEHVELFG